MKLLHRKCETLPHVNSKIDIRQITEEEGKKMEMKRSKVGTKKPDGLTVARAFRSPGQTVAGGYHPPSVTTPLGSG